MYVVMWKLLSIRIVTSKVVTGCFFLSYKRIIVTVHVFVLNLSLIFIVGYCMLDLWRTIFILVCYFFNTEFVMVFLH